jgi:hypothetical protein
VLDDDLLYALSDITHVIVPLVGVVARFVIAPDPRDANPSVLLSIEAVRYAYKIR